MPIVPERKKRVYCQTCGCIFYGSKNTYICTECEADGLDEYYTDSDFLEDSVDSYDEYDEYDEEDEEEEEEEPE